MPIVSWRLILIGLMLSDFKNYVGLKLRSSLLSIEHIDMDSMLTSILRWALRKVA